MRPILLAVGIPLLPACGVNEPAASFADLRAGMVREQIEARGIRDPLVLEAMRRVERHRFVPPAEAAAAYDDRPLPIGYDQTISQPYIVAFMTEALALRGGERVLEVGTGSGYQAAVLAAIGAEVYSIEIVEPLGRQAEATLRQLGIDNVHVRLGDGYAGWPEAAPFAGILVTAAADHVPPDLLAQLQPGGRLVIPVGRTFQELLRITRTPHDFREERLLPVRFVPMTGEAAQRRGG
jgi:protein-L-isoaspartate(D-aspartate) O-methyltransferase